MAITNTQQKHQMNITITGDKNVFLTSHIDVNNIYFIFASARGRMSLTLNLM